MKNFVNLLLSVLLIFLFGFTSCEPQLQDILPPVDQSVPDGMVLIPAGEVTLGAPPGAVHADVIASGLILAERTVSVDDFYIDTHEVTIAEFQTFVDAIGYDTAKHYSWNWFAGSTPDHPVFASYDAAQAYAAWAGKRLPTDAEWEKAARGGRVRQTYPWGDDTPAKAHAHIDGRNKKPYTVPVGSYAPNAYGLYDMAGNVAEWVYTSPDVERLSYRKGERALACGGNWNSDEFYARVYMREFLPRDGHFTTMGFRCAKDAN